MRHSREICAFCTLHIQQTKISRDLIVVMHPFSWWLTAALIITSLLHKCFARSPQCDPRSNPPTKPSFQDCEAFLWNLSKLSHQDRGAYKWYGRQLDPCKECVKLPTIIHWKNFRCAAIVDVDDADEEEIVVFGLTDLWRALSDVVGFCWLREQHNGRGYPSGSAVWAALIRGLTIQPGLRVKDMENRAEQRNSTMSVLDLDELYHESAVV